MWTGLGMVVFIVMTAFDYRWLQDARLADLRREPRACSS